MSSAEIATLPESEGFRIRWADLAPFIALGIIILLGTLINSNFMAANNILNVITRSAFIAIIGVGATFVIATGGLDLSIGSMLAFVVGIMIMAMNALAPVLGPWAIPAGALVALVVGSLCGLMNGLIITVGRIEPFIVTLGTMGIFRALITYMTDGGSLSIDRSLRSAYRPVYFGDFLGVPYPVIITLVIALLGAFILYRTKYGRRVTAVGSNAEVARFSGVRRRSRSPGELPAPDQCFISQLTPHNRVRTIGRRPAAQNNRPRATCRDHRPPQPAKGSPTTPHVAGIAL